MQEQLNSLIAYGSENGRVCPLPVPWNELWEMLPERRREGFGWQPPLPLILAAWGNSSSEDKRQRLHEHLAWALAHGALNEVDAYLRGLSEDQWLHGGEWPA